VLFGLGIVENGYGETAKVKAMPPKTLSRKRNRY